MTDYAAVLETLYPHAEYTLNGTFYDGIVWHSEGKKPSKKTLDDAWPQVQYQREYAAVKAERRARYQAETDGIYMAAVRDDLPLDDWKAAVAAIKADLPYPQAPA